MAVFRIEKNKNYTSMANYHFYDKSLSWKAKGILSNMLSLPDDWDYSLAGLATLSNDGMSATRSAIKELEEHGYLIRKPIRRDGKIADWEYLIFEKPQVENQVVENQQVENQQVEKPQVEKRTQLNTNKPKTKKSNTNKPKTKEKGEKRKPFSPPTLAEVQEYCRERKNNVDPQKFYDYFTAADWYDSKGKKVASWKQKIITWESYSNDKDGDKGKPGGSFDTDDFFNAALNRSFDGKVSPRTALEREAAARMEAKAEETPKDSAELAQRAKDLIQKLQGGGNGRS